MKEDGNEDGVVFDPEKWEKEKDLQMFGDYLQDWLNKAPTYAFAAMNLNEGEFHTVYKALLILERQATIMLNTKTD